MKFRGIATGLAGLALATGMVAAGPAPAAQAVPYACTMTVSGRDLGWYGDVRCYQGYGGYRAVAKCNGFGGTAYGNWVGVGQRSSAWCGWWGVSSVWYQTR